MAMPLNEGDSATMPVDEEPAPAPAPTISEILAAAVATGGAGGAASSNSLMVTAPEEDEYDDDDALSTGSATAVPREGRDRQAPVDERRTAPLAAVAEHGPRRWPVLAVQMPGREGKQCRERWFNFLRPSVDKSAWTEEEDS